MQYIKIRSSFGLFSTICQICLSQLKSFGSEQQIEKGELCWAAAGVAVSDETSLI